MSAQTEYRIENLDAFAPVQSYCVHNATDDPVVLIYDAEERVIPAFSQVAVQKGTSPDGPMLDSKGKPRPGTLRIHDFHEERGTSDGGRPSYWSARDAIKHQLGIDTKKGVATGPKAEMGVSFVPSDATDAQFAKIAQDGRVRFMRWMEKHSTEVIQGYDERNNNRVKAGMERLPGDATYMRAMAIIAASRKMKEAEAENLMKTFEDQMAAPIEVKDSDAEFQSFVRFETERVARESNLKTDVTKLVESMTANPEAMALLRQKYKVRKLRDGKSDTQTIEDPSLTTEE